MIIVRFWKFIFNHSYKTIWFIYYNHIYVTFTTFFLNNSPTGQWCDIILIISVCKMWQPCQNQLPGVGARSKICRKTTHLLIRIDFCIKLWNYFVYISFILTNSFLCPALSEYVLFSNLSKSLLLILLTDTYICFAYNTDQY